MRSRSRLLSTTAILLLSPVFALAQQGPPPTPAPPASVSSSGIIAAAGEPGEKLVVSGQVFAPDGKTPAANVFVYAYQTDATGEYHNVDRVARLHGWVKSDASGKFEFHTIRPGPYPGRSIPAHIHMHAWGGGYPLQWTPDLKFADDALLSARDRADAESLGATFNNICRPEHASDGAWHCTIRLRLQHETNYPAQYRDDPRTRN